MARYFILDGGDLDYNGPLMDSDLVIEKDAERFNKTLAFLRGRGDRLVEGEIDDEALATLVAQAERRLVKVVTLPTGHQFYPGGFVDFYRRRFGWER